ncbi:MAG TPA: lytic transglycosylase domain-containing protein [Prolixibacteraceae bacterium]
MSKHRISLPKLAATFSLIAICVISCGLFINSSLVQEKLPPAGPSSTFNTPVEIPVSVEFAGEKIALDNFDIRESLDRELLVNSYFQSQTILYLKKSVRYFHLIEPILKKNNIPDDFKYLCLAESGFQERIVSPAGAVGLWQLMKKAATENGLEVNTEVDERYNMERSTEAACCYLNHSYNEYGSWIIVAASYNMGVSGINRQTELQDSKNYFDLLLNDETSRYVYRILALKLILENPEKYGFKVTDGEKYPILKCKEITLNDSVINLALYAHQQGINYKILKYFNPWLRQSSLKNPTKKSYLIKIPEPGTRSFEPTIN